MKTDQLDELDRGLVHALQVSGRAPFGVIAGVLGVFDQTIARRYRVRSQGVLRVVGLPDSLRLGPHGLVHPAALRSRLRACRSLAP